VGNVLLIHPLGYSAEDASADISRMANIMPPLGLVSMAAYLERRGITTDIIDCYAHPDSTHMVRDYILEHRPSIVGFSTATANFLDGEEIGRMAKAVHPDVRVVFGGPHVSALREKVLEEYPSVDFAVVGEGEDTLLELAEGGIHGPEDVKGLVYRNSEGEVVFTGYRDTSLKLDDLPFPAYEKLDGFPAAYKLPIFNYPHVPNTSCISSRGCPYACSYCDRSVFRRSFRYNSAEYLYEHMKYLNDRFGIRHINFYDDQFTFNRKRIERFTDLASDRPLGMTFNCAVRAEHIDGELIRQMKAAGCWMVSLGIESGDPGLLAQHRQNPNLDMLAEKIRLLKTHRLRVKGLFMIGLPGESEESFRRSMDYAFSLPIDDFNLAKFTPFPGSPIYENIHELGQFDEDWRRMDCMHFQFVPKGMTRQRLEHLFTLFYKTHFKRPKVLLDYAMMTWRSPDSTRRFLSNLGSFLKFARTNKRIRKN
jgi:radical SAM superfamily enzyme YgiQ (UPF0313 family)